MMEHAIFYDKTYYGAELQNYLQGRLVHTLVAGEHYCVTFYVVKGMWAHYSINKIAAYLDDGSIDTTSHPAAPQTAYTPQVIEMGVISDTLNWVKIQGSFIARGHEKFITIGVFADTGNVIHISPSGGGYYGLYVVDDVSVLPADARADAGRDTTIRHPGDTARIGVPGSDGIPAYWYQLGSSTAIDSGGSIKVHPMVIICAFKEELRKRNSKKQNKRD